MKELSIENKFLKKINDIFEDAIIYRIIGQFRSDFNEFRNELITYIFTLLENGTLHREMNFQELKQYLSNTFSGFSNLIQRLTAID